jgi:hypothetical protein
MRCLTQARASGENAYAAGQPTTMRLILGLGLHVRETPVGGGPRRTANWGAAQTITS